MAFWKEQWQLSSVTECGIKPALVNWHSPIWSMCRITEWPSWKGPISISEPNSRPCPEQPRKSYRHILCLGASSKCSLSSGSLGAAKAILNPFTAGAHSNCAGNPSSIHNATIVLSSTYLPKQPPWSPARSQKNPKPQKPERLTLAAGRRHPAIFQEHIAGEKGSREEP